VPIAERAKPRRIPVAVAGREQGPQVIEGRSASTTTAEQQSARAES